MRRAPPRHTPTFATDRALRRRPARSTQITGKKILAAALAPVNAEAASKCADERSWRFKYKKHFVKSVEVSAASPDAALKVAKAGLDYMYDNFEFHRDGKSMVLRKALQTYKGTFSTATIKGTGRRPDKLTLEVPYNGKVLAGDELELQLDKWVRQGVCELSCGAAISQARYGRDAAISAEMRTRATAHAYPQELPPPR